MENESLESHSRQPNTPSVKIKCREQIIKRVKSEKQGNSHAKKMKYRVWVTGRVPSER